MGRKKQLTINFYCGDDLTKIRKKTEGLFPLYVIVRYDSKKITFKSIKAKRFATKLQLNGISEKMANNYIETNIYEFIKKEKNYLNNFRRFIDSAFAYQKFDVELLSNDFLHSIFNVELESYLKYLINDSLLTFCRTSGLEEVIENNFFDHFKFIYYLKLLNNNKFNSLPMEVINAYQILHQLGSEVCLLDFYLGNWDINKFDLALDIWNDFREKFELACQAEDQNFLSELASFGKEHPLNLT